MAGPNVIQAQYDISEEIREQISEDYTVDDFMEATQGRSDLRTVFNNCNTPEKKQEFMLLWGISQNASVMNGTSPDDMKIVEKADSNGNKNFYLMMKNFGAQGINFTIQDGKSLIFEAEGLDAEKRKELARYFYNMGFTDFKFPETMQGQEYSRDFQEEQTRLDNIVNTLPKNASNNVAVAAELPKGKKHKLKDLVKSMKIQAQICNFNPDLLRTVYAPDGSVVLCFYNSASDMKHDGDINKDGEVQHKKAFAVKMKQKNGQWQFEYYLPEGKALDKNQTKMMMNAAKANGAIYFDIPDGAPGNAGASMGAFWEGAGKSLLVPRASCNPGPNDVALMIETAEKENKHSRTNLLKWKQRLADELQAMEDKNRAKVNGPIIAKFHKEVACGHINLANYQQDYDNAIRDRLTNASSLSEFAKESYLKNNGGYENTKMDDQIGNLRGALKYDRFANNYLSTLTELIDKNIFTTDASKKWDAIEVCAAYTTLAQMIKDFGDPSAEPKLNLDTRDDVAQKNLLLKEFKERMNKEKIEVAKNVRDRIAADDDKKTAKRSAISDIQKNAQNLMTSTFEEIKTNNGVDMKTPIRASLGSPYKEDKYFSENGTYIGKPSFTPEQINARSSAGYRNMANLRNARGA